MPERDGSGGNQQVLRAFLNEAAVVWKREHGETPVWHSQPAPDNLQVAWQSREPRATDQHPSGAQHSRWLLPAAQTWGTQDSAQGQWPRGREFEPGTNSWRQIRSLCWFLEVEGWGGGVVEDEESLIRMAWLHRQSERPLWLWTVRLQAWLGS